MQRTVPLFVIWDDKMKSSADVIYKGKIIGTIQGNYQRKPKTEYLLFNAFYTATSAVDGAAELIQVATKETLDQCCFSILGYHVLKPCLLITDCVFRDRDYSKLKMGNGDAIKEYIDRRHPQTEG